MLKFRTSNLSKLITSLEDYKCQIKKASEAQGKTFRILDEWASDSNNSAIHDVTSKLTSLYTNLEMTLDHEKYESIQKITEMFINFKEYDAKVDKYIQHMKNAEKMKKKCDNDIKKCPSNKSIRDCEVKYEKACEDLRFAEFKLKQTNEEIEGTKSILFKAEFMKMNEIFVRQNEAEKVLLNAMANLIEKIPDVSNEEVDDIKQIKYTKHAETNRICTRAYKKLHRISTTRINIVNVSPMKACRSQIYESGTVSIERPISKFKRIKSKIMRHSGKFLSETQLQQTTTIREEQESVIEAIPLTNIFPCLDSLNNSLTNLNLKYQPPPTYSDSESAYNDLKNIRHVLPSAPEQSFTTVCSEAAELNAYYNDLSVRLQEATFGKEDTC